MTNPVQSGDLGSSADADTHRVAETPVVSGHTPGPWVTEALGPYTPLRCIVNGPDRRSVADCGKAVGNSDWGFCMEVPEEEIEANARLIAAAPDLLEALTDVLNHSGARDNYHALKYADAVEKAEAAIRKATGETQ